MSDTFRELLKKVGSGAHTSEALTRTEAETATRMILLQEATPIQIGAFLIAHRIKRPTGTELAGMLDAYDVLGPKVPAIPSSIPVTVFSVPYDGRSRTAPMLPLTALVLATAGCPILMHGGDRMATKYGVPLTELWQSLGVNWAGVSLAHIQQSLAEVNLGFLYIPQHFPLLQPLAEAREQLGKRPPFATLELFWCPYAGEAHLVSGYVHPPTEMMLQEALQLRGLRRYTTVKGLEGSCDLPRNRTAIIGVHHSTHSPNSDQPSSDLERLLLNARDLSLQGREVPYHTLEDWAAVAKSVLKGNRETELYRATLWNSGFYLWHLGRAPTLAAGVEMANTLLQNHQVADHLVQLRRCLDGASVGVS
jgi:anthranilate phosphoribosyltransferase